MSTEREVALAALRDWSAPGRRAQLLAAAWRAGARNIRVLAEAARVSRQTAYTDLESRGINPRTDRTETPTMQSITVGPYTGRETDEQFYAIGRDLARQLDDMPEGQERARAFGTEYDRHHAQHQVARYHNTMIPYVQRVAEAREQALRALHLVETRWDALRTAPAWMAAHHAYVEAVATARTAVESWSTAIDEYTTRIAGPLGFVPPTAVYEQYVPADQRLNPVDTDEAALAATELEENYARRRAIARETLTLPAEGVNLGQGNVEE